MSVLMVIVDGMEDDACPELDGMTPLSWAKCPHIRELALRGRTGLANHTPPGRETDSLTCILTMLGVPAEQIPRGRAWLEALAVGLAPEEKDLILRCNLVALDEEGRLASACGGDLSDGEMNGAVREVSRALGVDIVHLGRYRNLLVLPGLWEDADSLRTYAPHQHTGSLLEDLLPEGSCPAAKPLRTLTKGSRKLLRRFALLPWGEAIWEPLPPFEMLWGTDGAVVSGTELVRGIGLSMGMHCPVIRGATGDTDADLNAKTQAALMLLRRYGFVLLHLNGADECAHRRAPREKADLHRRVDAEGTGPILNA